MEKDSQNQTTPAQPEKTAYNTVWGWLGMFTTFGIAILLKDKVSAHFKEVESEWFKIKPDNKLLNFLKPGLKVFDPKLWKSNLAMLGTIIVGNKITEASVDKIYNHPEDSINPVIVAAAKYDEQNKTKSWSETEKNRETSTPATEQAR